jgi:Na+-driven multidrug efflux pump
MNGVWVCLEAALIFRQGWGIEAAALAAVVGQYVGLGVSMSLLIRDGALALADLMRLPLWADVQPFLEVPIFTPKKQ